MPFDLRRIVAVLGIGTLLVGIFYPMIHGNRFLEGKTFWSWGGDWDGIAVVAMAILAALLVWREKYRWLLPIGALSLYLVRATYVEFYIIQARAAELRAAGARDGLSNWIEGEIGLDLGLWIIVAGAMLLTVAALMPTFADSGGNFRRFVR